jgi:hypothetical protein
MAWDWGQDWWKVALGAVAVGGAAFTGGASLALLTATAATTAIVGSEMLENEEAKLDIQEQELALQQQEHKADLERDYNNAIDGLGDIKANFDMLLNTTIPGLEEEIGGLEHKIDRWDEEKDLAMGEIEAEIATYDSLLSSWQTSYDAQTKSAMEQGRDTLSGLLSNWANAEVVAADRGAGGSMALVAAQEKRRAARYAGDDLSLGGGDGIFGASYDTLVANLASQKSQYETRRGLLGGQLESTDIYWDQMLEDWQGDLTEKQGALAGTEEQIDDYFLRYDTQWNIANDKRNELGLTGTDPLLDMYGDDWKKYKQRSEEA